MGEKKEKEKQMQRIEKSCERQRWIVILLYKRFNPGCRENSFVLLDRLYNRLE